MCIRWLLFVFVYFFKGLNIIGPIHFFFSLSKILCEIRDNTC